MVNKMRSGSLAQPLTTKQFKSSMIIKSRPDIKDIEIIISNNSFNEFKLTISQGCKIFNSASGHRVGR